VCLEPRSGSSCPSASSWFLPVPGRLDELGSARSTRPRPVRLQRLPVADAERAGVSAGRSTCKAAQKKWLSSGLRVWMRSCRRALRVAPKGSGGLDLGGKGTLATSEPARARPPPTRPQARAAPRIASPPDLEEAACARRRRPPPPRARGEPSSPREREEGRAAELDLSCLLAATVSPRGLEKQLQHRARAGWGAGAAARGWRE